MRISRDILLTMWSVRLGNFFDAINTLVHVNMPQKIAKWIFCLYLNFSIFLPTFDNCNPIWSDQCRIWFQYRNDLWQFILWAEIVSLEGTKGDAKTHKRAKKSQKLKISQKSSLQFSGASAHVLKCFIPRKNSRTSLITWLKGYFVIFTYGQDTSKQSCITNRGPPCSFRPLLF